MKFYSDVYKDVFLLCCSLSLVVFSIAIYSFEGEFAALIGLGILALVAILFGGLFSY